MNIMSEFMPYVLKHGSLGFVGSCQRFVAWQAAFADGWPFEKAGWSPPTRKFCQYFSNFKGIF